MQIYTQQLRQTCQLDLFDNVGVDGLFSSLSAILQLLMNFLDWLLSYVIYTSGWPFVFNFKISQCGLLFLFWGSLFICRRVKCTWSSISFFDNGWWSDLLRELVNVCLSGISNVVVFSFCLGDEGMTGCNVGKVNVSVALVLVCWFRFVGLLQLVVFVKCSCVSSCEEVDGGSKSKLRFSWIQPSFNYILCLQTEHSSSDFVISNLHHMLSLATALAALIDDSLHLFLTLPIVPQHLDIWNVNDCQEHLHVCLVQTRVKYPQTTSYKYGGFCVIFSLFRFYSFYRTFCIIHFT